MELLLANKQTIIMVIVGVLGIFLAFKFIKGIVKFLVLGGCIGLLVFGVANGTIEAPEKLKDTATILVDRGTEIYELVENNSDKIKIEEGKISILIEDKWVSTEDIKSFVKTDSDSVQLTLDGEAINVEDEAIAKLMKLLSEK